MMKLVSSRGKSILGNGFFAMSLLLVLIAAAVSALNVPPMGFLREQESDHMCSPGLKQTTGYFNIDPETNKNYFYWYFPSLDKPETDPLVLWLTGGPGCSGELALFAENGPCTINATGVFENEYTWNQSANMIYIDQPAGTGFSYSDASGYDTDEVGVAKDLDAFLRAFVSKHPEVAKNDFYIFGESYAGHYVPATAYYVHTRNQEGAQPHLNLVGIGVGNGLTNPEIQYQYYPEMIYNYTETKLGQPLVSLDTYTEMVQNLPSCIELIQRCNKGDTDACGEGLRNCAETTMFPYQMTGRNVYDIRIPCENPPLCYDFSPITKFLNDPAVQKSIGVNREWESCNMDVNRGFQEDFLVRYDTHIPNLLESGIRVLIYAGDCDYICNWIGNDHWTLELKWSGQTAFKNAKVEALHFSPAAKPDGTIRTANGFSFVTINNAGHMVPLDQPRVALFLFSDFVHSNSKSLEKL